MQVRGSEGFYGQVCDPVPELIMTRRDEAAPLAFESVEDCKFGVAAVKVFGEVCGI